ncbi:hypothetical protein ACLKA7_016515 [Drosophila subpalustris]
MMTILTSPSPSLAQPFFIPDCLGLALSVYGFNSIKQLGQLWPHWQYEQKGRLATGAEGSKENPTKGFLSSEFSIQDSRFNKRPQVNRIFEWSGQH